jgi:hypothetical protein
VHLSVCVLYLILQWNVIERINNNIEEYITNEETSFSIFDGALFKQLIRSTERDKTENHHSWLFALCFLWSEEITVGYCEIYKGQNKIKQKAILPVEMPGKAGEDAEHQQTSSESLLITISTNQS